MKYYSTPSGSGCVDGSASVGFTYGYSYYSPFGELLLYGRGSMYKIFSVEDAPGRVFSLSEATPSVVEERNKAFLCGFASLR